MLGGAELEKTLAKDSMDRSIVDDAADGESTKSGVHVCVVGIDPSE